VNQNYYIGNSLCLVQCAWFIIYLHLAFKATQLWPFEGSTSYCLPHKQSCHIQLLAIWNKHSYVQVNHLLSLFSQDEMGPNNMNKI
jgi:hypothetical protein